MRYSYPFYAFPNARRYPLRNPYYGLHNVNPVIKPNTSISYSPSISSPPRQEKQSCEHDGMHPKNEMDSKNSSEDFFEIFGLKLYFDDLLIMALLFFLYQEEVKDAYLYIALILLLLS